MEYRYYIRINYCALPIFKTNEYNRMENKLRVTNNRIDEIGMIQSIRFTPMTFGRLKFNIRSLEIDNFYLLSHNWIYFCIYYILLINQNYLSLMI